MPVYVDKMRKCIPNSKWRYSQCCHLIADTIDELHRMAIAIGLKRAWFQKGTIPHYDLTTSKRRLAIIHGAFGISDAELVRRIREHRKNGKES